MEPLELKIIIGSTRPGRAADQFVPWLVDRAERHGGFAVELVDLRDFDLPIFQESNENLGAARYSTPDVQRWNDVLAAGDAYLFVFPEYNHSIPGVLKNAVDHAFGNRLRRKPAGFVSYSAGPIGGARAVEHMVGITVERQMAPARSAVLLGGVGRLFGEDGLPVEPGTDKALTQLLDDVAWWGDALRNARVAGERRAQVAA